MKRMLISIATFAAAISVMLICGGASARNEFDLVNEPNLLSEPMNMLLLGGFLILLGKIAKKTLQID